MITFDRNGESGNIFFIMGEAIAELKVAGRENDAKQLYEQVVNSGSYEEALEIIAEYVDIVEVEEV